MFHPISACKSQGLISEWASPRSHNILGSLHVECNTILQSQIFDDSSKTSCWVFQLLLRFLIFDYRNVYLYRRLSDNKHVVIKQIPTESITNAECEVILSHFFMYRIHKLKCNLMHIQIHINTETQTWVQKQLDTDIF